MTYVILTAVPRPTGRSFSRRSVGSENDVVDTFPHSEQVLMTMSP
jgi:hypothetical protein